MGHVQILKILSQNIHKGYNAFQSRFVVEDLKNVISLSGADLVFLQEVQEIEGRKFSGKNRDLETKLEFLADTLWPHYAYGKNAVYDKGHHGNAVLSRFPFIDFENIDISTNRLERRGLLHAVVDIPATPNDLHVICTHFNLLEASRVRQIEALCERVQKFVPPECPLLIVGDFNDWRKIVSPVLRQCLGVEEVFVHLQGRYAKTFPSWFPMMSLDRIYFKGLDPLEARVIPDGATLSDHLPLFAELAFSD